jgi:hypothetical protein
MKTLKPRSQLGSPESSPFGSPKQGLTGSTADPHRPSLLQSTDSLVRAMSRSYREQEMQERIRQQHLQQQLQQNQSGSYSQPHSQPHSAPGPIAMTHPVSQPSSHPLPSAHYSPQNSQHLQRSQTGLGGAMPAAHASPTLGNGGQRSSGGTPLPSGHVRRHNPYGRLEDSLIKSCDDLGQPAAPIDRSQRGTSLRDLANGPPGASAAAVAAVSAAAATAGPAGGVTERPPRDDDLDVQSHDGEDMEEPQISLAPARQPLLQNTAPAVGAANDVPRTVRGSARLANDSPMSNTNDESLPLPNDPRKEPPSAVVAAVAASRWPIKHALSRSNLNVSIDRVIAPPKSSTANVLQQQQYHQQQQQLQQQQQQRQQSPMPLHPMPQQANVVQGVASPDDSCATQPPQQSSLGSPDAGGASLAAQLNRKHVKRQQQQTKDLNSGASAAGGAPKTSPDQLTATDAVSPKTWSPLPVSARHLETVLAAAPQSTGAQGETCPPDVGCPPGFVLTVYNGDISQHFTLKSEDVQITRGSIKYVDHHSRYGAQMRFRFQLCHNYLLHKCPRMSECSYIHATKLPQPSQVHLNPFAPRRLAADRHGHGDQVPASIQDDPTVVEQYETLPAGFTLTIHPPNASHSTTQAPGGGRVTVRPQPIPSEMILWTVGGEMALQYTKDVQAGRASALPAAAVVATNAAGGENAAAGGAGARPRHCAHYQFKRLCNLGRDCHFIHSKVPFAEGITAATTPSTTGTTLTTNAQAPSGQHASPSSLSATSPPTIAASRSVTELLPVDYSQSQSVAPLKNHHRDPQHQPQQQQQQSQQQQQHALPQQYQQQQQQQQPFRMQPAHTAPVMQPNPFAAALAPPAVPSVPGDTGFLAGMQYALSLLAVQQQLAAAAVGMPPTAVPPPAVAAQRAPMMMTPPTLSPTDYLALITRAPHLAAGFGTTPPMPHQHMMPGLSGAGIPMSSPALSTALSSSSPPTMPPQQQHPHMRPQLHGHHAQPQQALATSLQQQQQQHQAAMAFAALGGCTRPWASRATRPPRRAPGRRATTTPAALRRRARRRCSDRPSRCRSSERLPRKDDQPSVARVASWMIRLGALYSHLTRTPEKRQYYVVKVGRNIKRPG